MIKKFGSALTLTAVRALDLTSGGQYTVDQIVRKATCNTPYEYDSELYGKGISHINCWTTLWEKGYEKTVNVMMISNGTENAWRFAFSFPEGTELMQPSSETFEIAPWTGDPMTAVSTMTAVFKFDYVKGEPWGKYKLKVNLVEDMVDARGIGYRGHQNLAMHRVECLNWTAGEKHQRINPENSPGKGLGDHNYCRNPDGHSDIWCYIKDANIRWEICDPLPTHPLIPINVPRY